MKKITILIFTVAIMKNKLTLKKLEENCYKE